MSNTKFVSNRDWQILLRSTTGDSYPQIKSIYKNHPSIKANELKILSKDDRDFLLIMKDKLVKQAESEWFIDERSVRMANKSEGISCQLCGQRPLVKVCSIENRFNRNKLIVGCNCVEHFDDYLKLNIEKILEEDKKLKRLKKLSHTFPNLNSFIGKWPTFLDSQPILIKSSVEEKYLNIGHEIDELYNRPVLKP